MRICSLIISATLMAALVLALAVIAVAADNLFIGTWKLNVGKSKFNPPSSAFKSDIVKIEALDNGLQFTFDRVDAEGKTLHIEQAPKFDGKDYPVRGDPATDAVLLKKIDANGFETVNRKGGKDINRVTVVFAKDGKSSTVTAKTKDTKGQEVVVSISIYEKQ
jgi:hypothetical protein